MNQETQNMLRGAFFWFPTMSIGQPREHFGRVAHVSSDSSLVMVVWLHRAHECGQLLPVDELVQAAEFHPNREALDAAMDRARVRLDDETLRSIRADPPTADPTPPKSS